MSWNPILEKQKAKLAIETKVLHVDPWIVIQEQFKVHATIIFFVTVASANGHLKARAKYVARLSYQALVSGGELLHNGRLQRVHFMGSVHIGVGIDRVIEEIFLGTAVGWGGRSQVWGPVVVTIVSSYARVVLARVWRLRSSGRHTGVCQWLCPSTASQLSSEPLGSSHQWLSGS